MTIASKTEQDHFLVVDKALYYLSNADAEDPKLRLYIPESLEDTLKEQQNTKFSWRTSASQKERKKSALFLQKQTLGPPQVRKLKKNSLSSGKRFCSSCEKDHECKRSMRNGTRGFLLVFEVVLFWWGSKVLYNTHTVSVLLLSLSLSLPSLFCLQFLFLLGQFLTVKFKSNVNFYY